MRMMCALGFDINVKDEENGWTPLMYMLNRTRFDEDSHAACVLYMVRDLKADVNYVTERTR